MIFKSLILVNTGSLDPESSVKLLNGSEIIAYNFGAPFKSLTTSTSPSKVTQETLAKGDPVVLEFLKSEEVWRKYVLPVVSPVLCESVVHYKCFQTFELSSARDSKRLASFNCSELHGDLIIKRIDSPVGFKSLKKLKKIHGRLIISGLQSTSGLDFDNLEEIGDYIFHGTSPSLQITNNRLNHVKFPVLKKVHCQKEKRRQCVVIGENYVFSVIRAITKITFGNSEVKMSDPLEESIKTVRNYEGIKSEKDLVDRKLLYQVEYWQDDFYLGSPILFIALSLVSCFSFIVVCVLATSQIKESQDYDLIKIDKMADETIEKGSKEHHEEEGGSTKSTHRSLHSDLGSSTQDTSEASTLHN
uniref:Recep_L_domain domain-containing protein n=1 Tax=Caenorhabditis japonica TaxID=281687 RepID=A0A8R1ELQ0_CAEJA